MSRYADLGAELEVILRRRRMLCGPKDKLGSIPQRGNEQEWDRLTRKAAEIRREMRKVRYGTDE